MLSPSILSKLRVVEKVSLCVKEITLIEFASLQGSAFEQTDKYANIKSPSVSPCLSMF